MMTRGASDRAPRRWQRWVRVALACAAMGLPACRRAAPSPPPNVILISIDCLNRRQLDDALQSSWAPAIAALAQDSIVFSHAHAQAPWTTPSHMSMLTGLYPSQHGRDVPWVLMQQVNQTFDRRPAFETLADRFAANGYETMAFVGKGSISAQYGLAQGFQQYHESVGNIGFFTGESKPRLDFPETEEAVGAWLDGRRPGPFFLFIHTYDLHYPRVAEIQSDEAALRHIDTYVGKLLQRLRQAGLYDSSLIILTGDHGSQMIHTAGKCCTHGAGHYEENLNVPLLLKLPGPPHGTRSSLLVRHVDILPTALDVAGLPLGSYRGPGVSMLQRLQRPQGSADPVTSSYSEADGRCVSRRALVTDRFKYIYTPADDRQLLLARVPGFGGYPCQPECGKVPPEELYDLSDDPFESHNLMLQPLSAESADALRRARAEMQGLMNLPRYYTLRVYSDPTSADETARRAAVPDESVKESMRALGYAPP
jgi:arylsulfatase A-like enzyme